MSLKHTGHAHIVTWLLSRGAQVEHCCSQGATALCIASQEGSNANIHDTLVCMLHYTLFVFN